MPSFGVNIMSTSLKKIQILLYLQVCFYLVRNRRKRKNIKNAATNQQTNNKLKKAIQVLNCKNMKECVMDTPYKIDKTHQAPWLS